MQNSDFEGICRVTALNSGLRGLWQSPSREPPDDHKAIGAAATIFYFQNFVTDEYRVAIDVLVQPDSAKPGEASTWNSQMCEQRPEGFKRSVEHASVITSLRYLVAETDLASISAAVVRAKSARNPAKMQRHATSLFRIPSRKIGLDTTIVEPSDVLIVLQQVMIEAVTPVTEPGGRNE